MKQVLITILVGFLYFQANAQKVASYSTGTAGQADYESFGFWINENGQRSFITYNYGADRKESRISYLGVSNFNGVKSFKIQFSNKLTLHVMSNGEQLQIADMNGKYSKAFKWEYEGPVNGVGTFCKVCATDAKDAKTVVEQYFK